MLSELNLLVMNLIDKLNLNDGYVRYEYNDNVYNGSQFVNNDL
jgi:hypothetical protein